MVKGPVVGALYARQGETLTNDGAPVTALGDWKSEEALSDWDLQYAIPAERGERKERFMCLSELLRVHLINMGRVAGCGGMINHDAHNPSVKSVYNAAADEIRYVCLRDVCVGEQLTCDYGSDYEWAQARAREERVKRRRKSE